MTAAERANHREPFSARRRCGLDSTGAGVPRSHRHGYSDYAPVEGPSVFGSEIRPEQVDATRAVPCILAPNHCSLHHAKMIHGSAANASTRRRCGYTMRYISAASRFNAQRNHGGLHQIYLARGQDRAGNTYADPSKPNQAWLEHFGVNQPRGH